MIPTTSFTEQEKSLLLSRTDAIRTALTGNIRELEQYPHPVLLVGDCYPGIWLEHNQDNVFLAEYAPEAAWAAQTIFMDFQREDGLLPFMMPAKIDRSFNGPALFWQLQSVYPFARCALEVAKRTNRPESNLLRIYESGARYDAWLGKYRNRAGTGLVEMYCEYDTGHDNDPRVTDGGISGSCPGGDAANMPDLPCMPVLSVDLSAMCCGGRMALAELADLLGNPKEAAQWRNRAEELKAKMRELLYDPADDFYYDRDRNGLRKYRTEHITRLFLNQLPEQEEFDRIYQRYFENPSEFLTPFPFPSMSVSDPHFDKTCPKNSWGSNTQALTSLRALLWLEHYGRNEERTALLFRWLRAFLDYDTTYPQELNPFDGSPIGTGHNYSPTLILFLEGVKLLKER